MRVVVDTNVWISALLNAQGGPAQVLAALKANRFDLVTAEEALDELRRVVMRPRIARRYGVRREDAEQLVALLRGKAQLVSIVPRIKLSRDPDDDLWADLAVQGQANVVVSRDGDVLAKDVREFLAGHGVAVLTVRRFLDRLAEAAPEQTD